MGQMSRFELLAGAHAMARLPTLAFPGPGGLPPAMAARYARALLSTPHGRVHLQPLAYIDARSHDVLASALLRVAPAFVCGVPIMAGLVHDIATGVGPDGVLGDLMAGVVDQSARLVPDVSLFLVTAPAGTALPGFVQLPTEDMTLTVKDGSRQGAPMVPVRSGEEGDLACIAGFARLDAPDVRFRLERSAAATAFAITRRRLLAGLSPEGTRELRFLVVEEGMRAAAYVVVTGSGGAWTLEECGDRDPTGARVGAMLQALAALTPGQPRLTLTAWLPPGFLPPQVEVTAVRPSAVRLFARAHGRAFDLAGLHARHISYWHGDL